MDEHRDTALMVQVGELENGSGDKKKKWNSHTCGLCRGGMGGRGN